MKVNTDKVNELLMQELSKTRLALGKLICNKMDDGVYLYMQRVAKDWITRTPNLPFDEMSAATQALGHYFKTIGNENAKRALAVLEDPNANYNKRFHINSYISFRLRNYKRALYLNRSLELVKKEFATSDVPANSTQFVARKVSCLFRAIWGQ